MSKDPTLLDQVESLQNLLIDRAKGRTVDEELYVSLHRGLIANEGVKNKLPRFVKTCGSASQFWDFIKPKFAKYAQREQYLRGQFQSLINELEGVSAAPSDSKISEAFTKFDAEQVHEAWVKALERRHEDPAAAITSARTLLETVCKHILDEAKVEYNDGIDLPTLYRTIAQQMNLAPEQHQEQIFKQILGGCQSVVIGLGAVRNKFGDAHGKGKKFTSPASRHAELAVNLAGSMAAFLVATWEAQKEKAAANN